jgi:hypothetical protein
VEFKAAGSMKPQSKTVGIYEGGRPINLTSI